MKTMKQTQNAEHDDAFFENVIPTKLTEGRRVKLNTEGWGLLTEYLLESVKINWQKTGAVTSMATMKIGDRSGQAVCLVTGPTVGLLFGLSPQEWAEVEKLCGYQQQLFYRYFKDGLSKNFGYQQKLFYHFCLTNQKSDVLVAIFRRGVNRRKKDKGDAFVEILELRKCDAKMLDLYTSHLRKSIELLS